MWEQRENARRQETQSNVSSFGTRISFHLVPYLYVGHPWRAYGSWNWTHILAPRYEKEEYWWAYFLMIVPQDPREDSIRN